MGILDTLKISRRHALRGVVGGVGVAMWLPVLDAMCNDNGTAFAQGEPFPSTFGVFFWGNGVHPGAAWTPTATGDGDAWQLPPNLEDFAGLKDSMTLVTGLDMMDGVFKGQGWGVCYVLAGGDGTICNVIADIAKSPHGAEPETSKGTQWMPTIDQLIAQAISTNEPFRSLETGIVKYRGDIAMGTVGANLAHSGPNQPLAPERDPVKLFNKLFSTGAPTTPTPGSGGAAPMDVSSKLRRSVLDAVLTDAKRLQMKVGAADAKRIEAHMESVRAIEQRVPASTDGIGGGFGMGSSESACKAPPAPTAQDANLDLSQVTATGKAMNQLIAAALACNMTRVYSHLWSGPRDDNPYPIIEIAAGHHRLTRGTADDNQKATSIEKYIMSQYADLARTLKDTSIGAGNLLDNTLIYGVSETSDPRMNLMRDYHIVLMGHAGGKVPGNRHYRKPGRKVTELMLTLQQVMGVKIDTFGTWDRTSTTMPEIL